MLSELDAVVGWLLRLEVLQEEPQILDDDEGIVVGLEVPVVVGVMAVQVPERRLRLRPQEPVALLHLQDLRLQLSVLLRAVWAGGGGGGGYVNYRYHYQSLH